MCLLCLLVKMQIPVERYQPCSVVPGGAIPSVHSQFPSCSFLNPFPLSFYLDIKTIHKVAGDLFSELHSQASGLKHRMWPVRLSFLAQSSLASGLGYLQLFSPWSLSDWSTSTLTSWASSCCNSNPWKNPLQSHGFEWHLCPNGSPVRSSRTVLTQHLLLGVK